MTDWRLLCCGVLLATAACQEGGSAGRVSAPAPSDLTPGQRAAFERHAVLVDSALGTFDDITVFERPSPTGPWELVNGRYAPVTVHGAEPARYVKDMVSDRPMMLPTRVQGFQGGDGQSSPYSSVGRMPGSNPEVQWVWVVRQYSIKDPHDDDFAHSGDIAVIGHHPRTGASAFYQFYKPAEPKPAQVIVSPFSEGGADFWSPIDTIAKNFQCQRCHDAGPFIHTPWMDQVRVREVAPGEPPAEPMVPSDPFGPYFFISAPDNGEDLFAFWDSALVARWGGGHLDRPDNACTQCHRISPDLIGLNENSTRYVGMGDDPRNQFSVISDGFQTVAYRKLPWMPPVAMPATDFYAGQETVALDSVWYRNFGADAAEVNRITGTVPAWRAAFERGEVVDVPAPDSAYRKILVDRPEQDTVEPGQSLWLVDTRMRANTDGDLQQWRYYGKGPGDDVRVAPVVYRRRAGDGSRVEFEVVFVGEPRGWENGEEWLGIAGSGNTFPLQQGDYFGVVFTNAGPQPGPAVVPYTVDDWARLTWPDGTTRYLNGFGHWQGYVTMQVTSPEAPAVGVRLVFEDADYRTYSFEFRNRI